MDPSDAHSKREQRPSSQVTQLDVCGVTGWTVDLDNVLYIKSTTL